MEDELDTPPTGWARVRFLAAQWIPPLALLILARTAIAAPFHVPTGSMVPSVEVGDRILVQKYAYGLQMPWVEPTPRITALSSREVVTWSDPERGDVVLFRHPDDPGGTDWLKRVIAVPGDRVSVRNGVPTVNGVRYGRESEGRHDFLDARCASTRANAWTEDDGEQTYTVLDSVARGRDQEEIAVPEGWLFVMGDNRDHSADSRYWGLLPRHRVRGRAVGVFSSGSCDREPWIGWRPL